MALLPQQPGAPPIMVPIVPSTGAHLINQQQQIRLAVAHAQAAAAAQQSSRVSLILQWTEEKKSKETIHILRIIAVSVCLVDLCVLFNFVFLSFSPLFYHLT